MRTVRKGVAGVCPLFILAGSVAVAAPSPATCDVNIESKPLADAVAALGEQCPIQLGYDPALIPKMISPGVVCTCTPKQAFDRLLRNTGIRAEVEGAFATIVRDNAPVLPPPPRLEPSSKAVDEVLLSGTRAITSSRDSIFPIQEIPGADLAASPGQSAEDFLSSRVAAANVVPGDPQSPLQSHMSQLDLYGRGSQRVAKLVNGRPLLDLSTGGDPVKGSFSTIPVLAIKRLTLRPGTSSATMGSGATGGAIDAELRDDVRDFEVIADFESPVDTKAAEKSVSVAGGLAFQDHTKVMWFGTYAKKDVLAVGDRGFAQRGWDRFMANDVGHLGEMQVPPVGRQVNIRSQFGEPLFGPGTASFTSVPAGATAITLEQLALNAGRYNTELPDTAQYGAKGSALLNGSEWHSVLLRALSSLAQEITLEFQAGESRYVATTPFNPFSWLSGAVIGGDAPNNPFHQAIVVSAPVPDGDGTAQTIVENRHALIGVTRKLPHQWQAGLDFYWARATVEASGNYAGSGAEDVFSGAFNILRDVEASPLDVSQWKGRMEMSKIPSVLRTVTLGFGGPIVRMGDGRVTLTGALEHAAERMGDGKAYEAFAFSPDADVEPLTRLLEQRRSKDSLRLVTRFFVSEVDDSKPCQHAFEALLAGHAEIIRSNVTNSRAPYASMQREPRAGDAGGAG